jgi:PST family polysaccharide transporter
MTTTGSFARDVKVGMAWTFVGRGGVQFFNLLASVALARLLTPSDFGVLGLALLVTGASGRASNLSFGMAIVQREDVRPDHLSTLFVTQLVINSFVCLGLVLAAPWVGAYFENPLVGSVLAVSSLNFLIRCLGVCPSAILRRGMGFKIISTSTILDAFINLIVATLLALSGFGVWSLVYGGMTAGLISKIYLIVASGWKPSLRVTRQAFNDLFGFGVGVSTAELLTFMTDRTSNFVIGKWLGTTALGFYEKGYSLMILPVKELGERVNRVLFPVFARIKNDSGRFRAAVRKTILSISLIAYPVFGSLIVLAPQVIGVMYGSQWEGAVRPFQILCVMSLPRLITQVMIVVIFVTGSARSEVTRRSVVAVGVLVGSFMGLQWGLLGVTIALVIVNIGSLLATLWQVRRLRLLEPVTDVLRPQTIPLSGGIAMMAAEWLSVGWTESMGFPAVGSLAVALTFGSLAYLGVIAVMRDRVLTRLLVEVREDLAPLVDRVPMAAALVRWSR